MTKRIATVALLLGAGGGFAPPLAAHHSFGAEYDVQKPITLTGVLTKVEWTSPHTHLYLDVKDDLFKGAKALYMNVEYFNAGTDQFRVEYGANEVDADGNPTQNAFAVANPPTKTKADTQTWTTQVFTLANPNLLGGMDGKADIRIDDMADGAEIIGRITISDADPRHPNLPQVDPAKPITIDGVKKDDEWDGAYDDSQKDSGKQRDELGLIEPF